MNQSRPTRRYPLPRVLLERLGQLRRSTRVQWTTQAIGLAASMVATLFLAVFILERLGNTPASLRAGLFGAAMLAVVMISLYTLWRAFWRLRRPEQVARLLGRRFPSLGDQLLGALELAEGKTGYAAPRLIEAALEQAGERAERFDFLQARPPRWSRRKWSLILLPITVAVGLCLAVPQAGWNTLARWSAPWSDIERYTFTRLAELPDQIVVPYAEPVEVNVALRHDSQWTPRRAKARYADRKLSAEVAPSHQYEFSIKKPTQVSQMKIAVGDAREKIAVRPLHRPELQEVEAEIVLPEYLQRTVPLVRDVRTGRLVAVEGSQVVVRATANRKLSSAEADVAEVAVDGATIESKPIPVDSQRSIQFRWKDIYQLAGRQPFELTIAPRADEEPAISWSGLRNGQVVLDTETVTFDVTAQDDFGVRQIGFQWQALGDPNEELDLPPEERVLAIGSPEAEELTTVGTFCAKELEVPPGVVWLRVFAEDYAPHHDRVESSVIALQIMTPDQHALWMNQQLRKWFSRADEVYKRELALHDVNRRLRSLPPSEINRPEVREEIERQAAAEQANAGRLANVTQMGKQLLQEASKNDQIGVGHLETLAEMLLGLEKLADERMPSVADLLQKAAEAEGKPADGTAKPSESRGTPPPAGQEAQPGESGDSSSKSPPAGLPSANTFDRSDVESEEGSEEDDSSDSSSGGARLTLPMNVLQGGGKGGSSPANDAMDEATEQQKDLLEEFARIRDELQKLLINMEGSTFVKRLKAASKRQFEVAADLERFAVSAFGAADDASSFGVDKPDQETDDTEKTLLSSEQQATMLRLASRESLESESMRVLVSDLRAYYDRVQMAKIKPVLDEMEEAKPARELGLLAEELRSQRGGDVMVEAEFWGETFDRWAEMLVDVASGGT